MKITKFYYAKLAKLKNRELSGFLNNITKSTGLLPENETLSIITENLHTPKCCTSHIMQRHEHPPTCGC